MAEVREPTLKEIKEHYGVDDQRARFILALMTKPGFHGDIVLPPGTPKGEYKPRPKSGGDAKLTANPFGGEASEAGEAVVDLHLKGLHDQRTHGRRRKLLGATPFRGLPRNAPAGATDSYYNSTRFKGFERNLHEKASELGVQIEEEHRQSGIWQGEYEPSVAVRVKGNPSDIEILSRYLARHYNQDAIMAWQPHRDGPDRHYTIHGVTPSAKAGRALGEHGFPGGSFTSNGLEIVDFNGENWEKAMELTKAVGGDSITITPGSVDFIEQAE